MYQRQARNASGQSSGNLDSRFYFNQVPLEFVGCECLNSFDTFNLAEAKWNARKICKVFSLFCFASVNDSMKRCTTCQTDKPENKFRRWRTSCLDCERKNALADYYSRREDIAWQANRAQKEKVRRRAKPELFIFNAAKTRAKAKGIAFDLELADISIPKKCPVLGIDLAIQEKQSDSSPTLDRFDNSRGYVKGNVFVISWRANSLKSNATADELEKILRYMRKSI